MWWTLYWLKVFKRELSTSYSGTSHYTNFEVLYLTILILVMHSAYSFLWGFKGPKLSVVSALWKAYRGVLTLEIPFWQMECTQQKDFLQHQKKCTMCKHCQPPPKKKRWAGEGCIDPTAAEGQGYIPALYKATCTPGPTVGIQHTSHVPHSDSWTHWSSL